LKPKSKTEDVAQYLADLCEDPYKNDIEKLMLGLDNNSTYKVKMKKLSFEHLQQASGIREKLAIELILAPAPNFNLVGYKIHPLRLGKFRHLPSNVTITEIEKS